MELRHVRYFVTVAEELHFGRAAERLHVAQSSLSQQVMQLERELGGKLLDRTGRRVELSDAGAAFLPRARALLRDADRAVRDGRRAARGQLGTLRLGFVDSAAYELLPPVLRELREEVPELHLELREVSVDTDLDTLHTEVDLAILRDADQVHAMRLAPLLVERLVAALAATDPLADAASLHLHDLADEPFVFPHHELADNVHDHLRVVCGSAGFRPRVAQVALQYTTMLGLVAAGYGVALVPAAARVLALPGVVYVPLEDPDATSSLRLATSTDRNSPALPIAAAIAHRTAQRLASRLPTATTERSPLSPSLE